MGEKFTCPRRTADGTDREDSPFVFAGSGKDEWQERGGMATQKNPHSRYCSYCGSMHPEDFMDAVRDGVELGPTDKSYKVYVDHMGGKFYTHHLHPKHSQEFYELYAAGVVNVGYPGHFYSKLYLPGLKPKE